MRFCRVGVWLLVAAFGGSACSGASSSSASDAGAGRGGAGGGASSEGGGAGPRTDGGPASDASATTTCGNGKLDPGEDCDDGNTVKTDGCDNCRFNCSADQGGDAVCSDGNYCNGAETCGANHECKPATVAPPEGTSCGAGSTCVSGECQLTSSVCGDGVVTPPEECDPPGRGCDGTCRFACVPTEPARDCTNGDICRGISCDDATHACVTASHLVDYTPCNAVGGPATPKKVCIAGACSAAYCGNQTIDPGEECDDGNQVSGDGCDACRFSCVPGDATRDCHSTDLCWVSGGCDTGTHQCRPRSPKASGTACSIGKNCVSGNCTDAVCGDAVVALGAEACDDGNLANGDGCDNDCTFSCVNPGADCASPGACRVSVCSSGVCSSNASTIKNGSACSTGGGSATCKSGACTGGTCGNGTVDVGEECDLGTGNGQNTGCEVGCTLSCVSAAQCDDQDPCNGVETCVAVTGGKRCASGSPKSDGTACGAGRICLGGGCRVGSCGDRYTDVSSGEACDPPNTAGCDARCHALVVCDVSGSWAAKTTINASWGDGDALTVMSGALELWQLFTVKENGLSVTGTVRACGLTIPDFSSAAAPETYGLRFAPTAFDETAATATTATLGNRSPGGSVTFATVALPIGLTMTTPLGPWPTLSDLAVGIDGGVGLAGGLVDEDADGKPGITAMVKTGTLPDGSGSYAYPVVNITDVSNLGRAEEFHLALRAIVGQSATLDSCTRVSGKPTVSSLDDHVIGGLTTTGRACTADEINLADNVKPIYTITDGTFTAVKLSGAVTCAAVRAALP